MLLPQEGPGLFSEENFAVMLLWPRFSRTNFERLLASVRPPLPTYCQDDQPSILDGFSQMLRADCSSSIEEMNPNVPKLVLDC